MVTRKRYLWQHPTGIWYVRIKGKYHKVSAEEGTPEFDRQYWEILTGKRADTKRSFKALIEIERQSDHWRDLKPRTRADYEKIFTYLAEKVGARDVARMTAADIYDAMDRNKHRVRFANYIPQALNILFKQAIRRRWRTDNPALGIEALAVPSERKKPHIPWPDWAVDKMRAKASPDTLLIFEIGVGSVQRPGDWVDFTWGDYDGDTLVLRQNKTDKPLSLPCTEHLKAALDAAKAGLGFSPMPNRHILTKGAGGRMGYRYMAHVMLEERKRLGLEAYDLHALRYRGVMELAWANCNDDEIKAYSGHSSTAMVIKYAGEARQIMRARQAREKRR